LQNAIFRQAQYDIAQDDDVGWKGMTNCAVAFYSLLPALEFLLSACCVTHLYVHIAVQQMNGRMMKR
jgi:hypothetical protein